MFEDRQIVELVHQDMNITYLNTDKGLWQVSLKPDEGFTRIGEVIPFPNFQLGIAGIPYGFNSALTTGYSNLPIQMTMEKMENEKDNIALTYKHAVLGLRVNIQMKLIPGTNILRQYTTVVNEGKEPVELTHLSSICMNGIATEGIRRWCDKDKIRVHYCMQTWEGEGQWRSAGLEELGLYPNSIHPCAAAIHFSSIGSWSTGRYLPMAVVEDMETNSVWYFQIETSTNWHFEIGHRGSWEDGNGALFLHADGADERFGGWSKELFPGESFSSVPTAVGCCKGNFNDAVRELTKYRRSVLKPQAAWDDYCPLVFNDYMNCLWGNPTLERNLPVIDAASEAGAECFCIDAGWFGDIKAPWGNGLGDWIPSTNRFGQEGLQGLVNYIKAKGMIPGLWLELEVCGEDAELGKMQDSWFLMRNGRRVGGGERWFLNFTNPEVRQYLHNVIDRLVGMGVGFFKNDYNSCVGNGCDIDGSLPAEGLINNMQAFYEFIDEVRRKHPRLILENCGSGAMREDYGILSHFHLQSSSDQEIYYNYPSILGGGLAAVLPEQLGIWAYPYPHLFRDMKNPEVLNSESYKCSMADGEQTVFNMINALCGNMYLSGRIDKADAFNMNLIKEAVALYKSERAHIHNSYPFWPIGFTRINNTNSWAAVGMANEINTRVLLAVWRLGSADEYMEFPLHGWNGRKACVKQLYPEESYSVDFYYNQNKGSLVVHLPKIYQARYFEIISLKG